MSGTTRRTADRTPVWAARTPRRLARQDAVTVSADDTRDGHRFDLAVARARALGAFYHPFAYAAATSDGAL
jgi:hypothetical protein